MWGYGIRLFENKKALFLAALGVRLLAGGWLGHFSHPATWEPEIIANNLLAGKGMLYDEQLGIPYRALLLPAYPLLCALVYLLTHHSQILLLILQCLFSAATCLQLLAIGRFVFPRPAVAWGGAWLIALHPGLIYYATLLHPLTLDLFSYLWVLWACLSLFEEPTGSKSVHLGLSAGLALLSRGTLLPFLPLSLLWFLLRAARDRSLRKGMRMAAIAVTVTSLIVLPWLVRNAFLFGRFPVFITSAGQSFWQGNNPLSVGTAHLADGRQIIDQLPPHLKEALAQSDEIGQNDLFEKEAWAFIHRNPGAAFKLFFRKWVAFWWFSPTTGIYYPPAYSRWYRVYQLAILCLAFLGFWSVRRRLFSPAVALPVAFLLSVTCFQSLFYVEGRHRWAVEPVLLLFTACGALSLVPERSSRDSGRAHEKTANSYSYLWKKAFHRPLREELLSYHLDEIQDSLGLPPQQGRILDAGCGDGIDLANQARRPGVKIVGAELSQGGSWASSQRILHLPTAHVVQSNLCALPFSDATFDFVYSYGVLHHMAVPSNGLREMVRVAKPGAWLAVYLYEDFKDRPLLWRILLWLGNLPRYLTTRLPRGLLYLLCQLASPLFYLLFTVTFRLSRRWGPLGRWTHRLPFRHGRHPLDLAGDLYDRFATPIEQRYSRESAMALFRKEGLEQVRVANRRGWMVAGTKPSGISPCGS